jgi:hypothetical protein
VKDRLLQEAENANGLKKLVEIVVKGCWFLCFIDIRMEF